jgi:hypothetical protein
MVERNRRNQMTKKTSSAMVALGALTLVCCECVYTGTAPLSPLVAGMVVAGGVGAYLAGTAMHKLSSDEKTLSSKTRL